MQGCKGTGTVQTDRASNGRLCKAFAATDPLFRVGSLLGHQQDSNMESTFENMPAVVQCTPESAKEPDKPTLPRLPLVMCLYTSEGIRESFGGSKGGLANWLRPFHPAHHWQLPHRSPSPLKTVSDLKTTPDSTSPDKPQVSQKQYDMLHDENEELKAELYVSIHLPSIKGVLILWHPWCPVQCTLQQFD